MLRVSNENESPVMKAERFVQEQIDVALGKYEIPVEQIEVFLVYLAARIFTMGAYKNDREGKMKLFSDIAEDGFKHIDKL